MADCLVSPQVRVKIVFLVMVYDCVPVTVPVVSAIDTGANPPLFVIEQLFGLSIVQLSVEDLPGDTSRGESLKVDTLVGAVVSVVRQFAGQSTLHTPSVHDVVLHISGYVAAYVGSAHVAGAALTVSVAVLEATGRLELYFDGQLIVHVFVSGPVFPEIVPQSCDVGALFHTRLPDTLQYDAFVDV